MEVGGLSHMGFSKGRTDLPSLGAALSFEVL